MSEHLCCTGVITVEHVDLKLYEHCYENVKVAHLNIVCTATRSKRRK